MNTVLRNECLVTAFTNPQNGSSPMWCYGTPVFYRDGDKLYATVPETGDGVLPTCNTRMCIYRYESGRWERIYVNPVFDQREPCPVANLGDGRLLVSINPCVAPFRFNSEKTAAMYYCEPYLLEFKPEKSMFPDIIKPQWDMSWPFTDHSYRGIAADRERGDIFLVNIEGFLWREGYKGRHHFAFSDKKEGFIKSGTIEFPRRACYPALALKNRAAYMMVTSDIDEPNEEWMQYKREFTGVEWDFDFRQLYFTYTDDIVNKPFCEPIYVEDVDSTAGHIRHLDMHVDEDGTAHLLYIRKNVWKPFMRDKFFPDLPLTVSLMYAKIRDGELVEKREIISCREDKNGRFTASGNPNGSKTGGDSFKTNDPMPDCGGFYTSTDGTLFITYYSCMINEDDKRISGNYIVRADAGETVKLPLTEPMKLFFTASERNGSTRSDILDLFGILENGRDEISYAAVQLS